MKYYLSFASLKETVVYRVFFFFLAFFDLQTANVEIYGYIN